MKPIPTHGYSGRALVDKLGIKSGHRVKTSNVPNHYLELISPVPADVQISSRLRSDIDVWHVFTTSKKELAQLLKKARYQIRPNGMIWVSWPKKSSGMKSEVTEDTGTGSRASHGIGRHQGMCSRRSVVRPKARHSQGAAVLIPQGL